MQWLCKEVADHLSGWAILDGQFARVDAIGNKIKAAIEVLGSFAARSCAVFLQKDSALVVLVQNRVAGLVALRL